MLSFIALILLMAALAAFAFIDMLYLDSRVYQGIAVSRIEHAVIEMRLHEKNLFLYKDDAAGLNTDKFAVLAMNQLKNEKETIKDLLDPTLILEFQADLIRYRKLLKSYIKNNKQDAKLESRIRAQGQMVSQIAARLFESERYILAQAISSTRWALAWSILILALLVFAIGWTLANSVVKPLRRLTIDLAPIAQGRFDHLAIKSKDTEMLAFGSAFNRMLGELELRRRRLLQSEKLAAMGVLLAGVAHEMKNPLSNISSTAQLMLEEIDIADRVQLAEWSGVVDSESERLRRIVDTLQEFNHGQLASHEPVTLSKLLQETLTLAHNPLLDSQAKVTLDVADAIVVMAEAHRLQQIFINLLLNATMSGDGVFIRITASNCGSPIQPLPNDAVVAGNTDCHKIDGVRMTQIVIADNGSGINAQKLSRVFEPFFTTRAPGKGMGLGLYIVQEIVQEHEGCIAIVSQEGRGTEVFINLPCAPEESV